MALELPERRLAGLRPSPVHTQSGDLPGPRPPCHEAAASVWLPSLLPSMSVLLSDTQEGIIAHD